MTNIAKGTFEVKVTMLKDEDVAAADGIGRVALAKTYSGDLAGTSKGLMLGSSDAAQTIGGYVAMESFTGTLAGKKGTFVLQHFGTMDAGKYELNVQIVPGSGTGDLEGIAGTLKLIIAGGKHSYELDYSLPR
jgi:hypothetical protein